MHLIFIIILLLQTAIFCEEIQYSISWIPGIWKINYAEIVNGVEFPYHPTPAELKRVYSNGGKVAFNVKVVDEFGNPVENIPVIASLQKSSLNVRDKEVLKEKTNKEGIVKFTGKCHGALSFGASGKGWYYSDRWEIDYDSRPNCSLFDGKWQPYGETYTIVLRPIRKQIRMLQPGGSYQSEIPAVGTPIGLDLFVCDWVKPYGKGKTADLLLQYDKQETEDDKTETLTFSFPNQGDGLYRKPRFKGSYFTTDYEASTDNSLYKETIIFHRTLKYTIREGYGGKLKREEDLVSQNNLGDEDFLVLRTRTQLDENGNVLSCHYSKILETIFFANGRLRLVWFTNPHPNDTNLEEDPNIECSLEELKEEAERAAEMAKALQERHPKQEAQEQPAPAKTEPVQPSVRQENHIKENYTADSQTAEAVSKVVSDFIAALKNGKPDDARECYGKVSGTQNAEIEKWLKKGIPFFSSGKVDSAVEKTVFVSGNAAIVPIRQWRLAKPEIFEIEVTCLVRRDGKWYLLPNFEAFYKSVNALDQETVQNFNKLQNAFYLYKNTLKTKH